jgi:dienelactone hydrolase
MRTTLAMVLLSTIPVIAAEPAPDHERGKAMIAAYFRSQSRRIADACLADLSTKAAWEAKRPRLREQFLEMMGLWPLPARTELKPVVTGRVDGDGYRVEKIHFQSVPGLYVTANLYLPKGDVKKAPTVLYVCGHANHVENGVSFGSKVPYQYHPAWFATHGYVCLILDTHQLHEIPGLHHGTYREGMWWWHARGYTPAGIELWNAIRALDYLETRPEVDATRFGLTGRSGGGATSWWTAAADERIKAVVPVAGIADLTAQIADGAQNGTPDRLKNGVIAGHCDCMFPVNTHRWDFAQIAALIAPRPLLLGNTDADDIFPVAGYRRLADKVRKVYALYGAEEKFQLLETKGPHKDTPELRIGINRWLCRWLKGDVASKVEDDLPAKLSPRELKVLDYPPEDSINASIHELFIKPVTLEMPKAPGVTKEWWTGRKAELMQGLQEKVFAGWTKNPSKLDLKPAGDVTHDGVRLRAFDFVSEDAIELRLFVMTRAGDAAPARVVLSVLDEPAWQNWCAEMGPEYREILRSDQKPKRDEQKFARTKSTMTKENVAIAAIAPRGIGPTRWAADGSFEDTQIRRRFPLIGQTLDGQRVWDARRAVVAIQSMFPKVRVRIRGERQSAGIAYYAGLYEPSVVDIELWHPPASHREGPTFLNIAKVLDFPQALALTDKPIVVNVKAAEREKWSWPLRLSNATGAGNLTFHFRPE